MILMMLEHHLPFLARLFFSSNLLLAKLCAYQTIALGMHNLFFKQIYNVNLTELIKVINNNK
jgi:hypothetical protein